MSLFAQAQTFCGSPPTTQAKSMLAVAVAAQLRVLESHLDKFRERIRELFAQHPDHELFGSLPGAGEKLAPRLLAELGDDRERFDSPEALQCYAGTAPVSYQSGQIKPPGPPEGPPPDGSLARRVRRPLAVAGVVENGLVRPLDATVKLPEHARVIIVASEEP